MRTRRSKVPRRGIVGMVGATLALSIVSAAEARQSDSLWSLYDDTQILIALDRNSVRWSGNRPTVDWQLVYAVPTPFEQYGLVRYKQRRVETFELDCAANTLRTLSIVEMTLDGVALETKTFDAPPEVVSRTSVGFATLEAVCRNNTVSLEEFPGSLDEMIAAYLQAVSNPPRPPAGPATK